MPVSTSVHISHCLSIIIQLNPKSVLDVGCGFGLWGFLCREYLDVGEERVWPNDWSARIDGIEFFEPYIQDHQRYLYDNITIGDIRDLASAVPDDTYELIIAGDVIEHMDKRDAEDVLDTLYAKATKALLVNIPIGPNWDHPISHGNPAELHRSEWSKEDFYPFPSASQMFDINGLQYGVFYCPKDATEEQCWDGIHAAAMAAESRREYDVAARVLERGLKRFPGDEGTILRLATAYASLGQIEDGLRIVTGAITNKPDFWHGHFIKATILKAAKRNDEALSELMRVLEQGEVDDRLRSRAQSMYDELNSA